MTGRAATAAAEWVWSAEPGARALYRAVSATCGSSGAEFADRVEATLAAALSFLAENPDLSRDLVVLGSDAQTLAAQRRWVASFGELLRAAAADLPGAGAAPRFRDAFLIDGIRFQIARRVLAGESARLPELRPELLGIVLAFYGEAVPEQKTRSGTSALESIEWEARAG